MDDSTGDLLADAQFEVMTRGERMKDAIEALAPEAGGSVPFVDLLTAFASTVSYSLGKDALLIQRLAAEVAALRREVNQLRGLG